MELHKIICTGKKCLVMRQDSKKLGDNVATRTLMTFWAIICYILDRNLTFKQLAALNQVEKHIGDYNT